MKETFAVILMAYMSFSVLGGFWALLTTFFPTPTITPCTYHSIAARSNIGYIAACEFFKPRF